MCCLFSAVAAMTLYTASRVTITRFARGMIRFTWQRNANVNIVEFMLDPSHQLRGRAVHSVNGLSLKEFLYCALTLANATDRLSYLIQDVDICAEVPDLPVA